MSTLDDRLQAVYEQIEEKQSHQKSRANFWKKKVNELGIGDVSIPWSSYIPEVPTPKQLAALLLNDYEEVLYGGATGGGKVVMRDGVVLTPFGFRKIQELKVGDAVNNPDGSVCRIIQLHPWRTHQVWRVHFHDGSYTDVAKDHLWLAWRSGKSKKHVNSKSTGEESAQVVETQELAKWLEQAKKNKRKTWPLIPICQPQRFNVTARSQADIDPYQLGYWLGDGHSVRNGTASWHIGLTSADAEHIETMLLGEDYTFRGSYSYHLIGETRRRWEKALTRLRLIGKKAAYKFIPREYKLGSLEVRLAVLQGLLDTDGTVDARGQVYFTSISKQLALDVQFIVQSLGGTATLFRKKAPFYRDSEGSKVLCRTAYTLYIKHRDEASLFRMARKRKRCNESGNMYRRVVKVEVLKERKEGRCITVSHPNGLYITNDFIVTHNSIYLLMAALQYIDVPGYSAKIFRRSLVASAQSGSVLDIAQQWLKGILPWDSKSMSFYIPGGGSVSFGYLDSFTDCMVYQGASFQFIGFDELTQFPETAVDDDGEGVCDWYLYMYSRLRKPTGMNVPLRIRSTANPGGVGHNWVKNRFKIQYDEKSKLFRGFSSDRPMVPSFCWDNPHLDIKSYVKSLTNLDPTTRNQLLMGDWDASVSGRIKSEWFRFRRYATRGPYLTLDPEFKTKPYDIKQLRFFLVVDPAASSREGPGDAQIYKNKEPSWTVISTWFVLPNGVLGLWNVIRFQKEIPEVCKEIHNAYKALINNEALSIRPEFIGIEWNGLNKGVYQVCERMGLPTRPLDPGANDKLVRNTDFANRAERGLVYLPHYSDPQAGNWLSKLENEWYTWTGHPGQAADQVDVASYAAICVSTEFSHYDYQGDLTGESNLPTSESSLYDALGKPQSYASEPVDTFFSSYGPK